VVVLAYLGFVANKFICNQWERKGMHIDVFSMFSTIRDQRQMSFIHLYGFFLTLSKCGFMLMSIFNSTRVRSMSEK